MKDKLWGAPNLTEEFELDLFIGCSEKMFKGSSCFWEVYFAINRHFCPIEVMEP